MPDYPDDPEVLRDMFRELNANKRALEAQIEKLSEEGKELTEKLGKQQEEEANIKLRLLLTAAAEEIAKEIELESGIRTEDIKPYLTREIGALEVFYKNQFDNRMKRILGKTAMLSRNISSGTLTMGDIWHQMLSNIWNLIFGPWVIGAGFFVLQLYLIMAYVPPSAAKPFLLIMAPIIGAGGVFMLNFMNSKNPMDWLTHIITGGIIAYAAGMFWVAIFGNIGNFPGGAIWFWITWFLSGLFIGTFQLYQLGGFRAVMQFAVLILLFSYLALGPYQAAYRQAIDRIKEPFTLAFRAVITAFNDAWILATNPTEWYARQQLRNARTEQPLERPKGVEFVRFESLTPSVGIPAEEEFEVFAIIQNQGRLEAKDISARIECNEFCDLSSETKDQLNRQKKDTLKQGEQLQLRLSGLKALKPGRDAFQIAKVTLFVNYTYATNSTLPVKVASQKEIERALAAKEDIFRPVQSIAMDGPAQLSLNVGPQPLKEKDESSLLIALLNSRPDGTIVLKKDMKLFVDVPPTIGTVSSCRSGSRQVVCGLKKDNHDISCTVNPESKYSELQIKATDFSTILPIFCRIQTASAEVFKSDRIKAEFPAYTFVTSKKLEVTVTQPLGVLKAPTPGAKPAVTPTSKPTSTTPLGMTVTPIGGPGEPIAKVTGGPLGSKTAFRNSIEDKGNELIFNTGVEGFASSSGFLKSTDKSTLENVRQNILSKTPLSDTLLAQLVAVEWAMEVLPQK